jgi:opacity protein-like surface antigen
MSKLANTRLVVATLAALVALGAAAPAHAQMSGDGFLFHRPNVRISVRGGYSVARAGSDLFDFTTENLTLKKSDFSGLDAGAAADISISDRMSLTLDAGYSRAKKGSEFRKFDEPAGNGTFVPIQQTTTFERVPITANLKVYLTSPGESVGSAAWIPARVTPWIGGGVGYMHYRFLQEGDFVDFNTKAIFPSTFDSKGWTPMAQGMAGADFTLTPSLALTGEARYLWARGDLSRDFGGFDRIDLSGISATLGLSLRL